MNRIGCIMLRRLLGALLCFLVMTAATFDVYADVSKKDFSITLQFEASYTSLDPVEDAGDTGYPDGIVSWSPREKIVTKFILSSCLYQVPFAPPPMIARKRLAHSRWAGQDILRYQEVCRI
jgi:hypothetical protein